MILIYFYRFSYEIFKIKRNFMDIFWKKLGLIAEM